jgi:hypothetical protein
MNTFLTLVVLPLFLLGMVTLAATRSRIMLAEANATMMVSIPILGPQTFTVFGHSTVLAAIFFGVVMYGMALKYLGYGSQEAHAGTYKLLFVLVLEFGAILLLQLAGLPNPLIDVQIRFAGAVVAAFWFGMTVFVGVLDRVRSMPALLAIPLVTILVQLPSGPVFFIAAFGGYLPWDSVVGYTVAGSVVKAYVALLAVPFLAIFLWMTRRHYLAGGTYTTYFVDVPPTYPGYARVRPGGTRGDVP